MRESGLFDASGFAIRTRTFDDLLLDAVLGRPRRRQVVSLVAGMDSRAFRLALPADVVGYDVDRRSCSISKQTCFATSTRLHGAHDAALRST